MTKDRTLEGSLEKEDKGDALFLHKIEGFFFSCLYVKKRKQ